MFSTASAYSINEIIYGETIPGPDSDYGVFVLRGRPEFGNERVLILAIMNTDGKTFWPVASDVKGEDAFFRDPLLSTRDRDLSAILQMDKDGNLKVSFFYNDQEGASRESSHIITLPAETSIAQP